MNVEQIKKLLPILELLDDSKTETTNNERKPVIVRTYTAGVHFGYLVSQNGQEVTLEKSRRIFRWKGALSCSELASKGLNVEESQVACPVNIRLMQAIEIIDCTPEAVSKIESATDGL